MAKLIYFCVAVYDFVDGMFIWL